MPFIWNRSRIFTPLLLVSFGLLVAACGMVPTGVEDEPTTKASATPRPLPSASPQSPQNQAATQEAIRRVLDTFNGLDAYGLDLGFMQKKGSSVRKGRYRIVAKKPRSMKIDVLEGNGAGSKILWLGGKTVQVRPTGLLSALVVTLDLHDDRVLSSRGYTIQQTDMPSFLGMLSAPRNRVTFLGQKDGQIYLQAEGADLLPDTVRAVFGIDVRTFYPTLVDLYDSKELVMHNEVVNFRAVKAPKLEI